MGSRAHFFVGFPKNIPGHMKGFQKTVCVRVCGACLAVIFVGSTVGSKRLETAGMVGGRKGWSCGECSQIRDVIEQQKRRSHKTTRLKTQHLQQRRVRQLVEESDSFSACFQTCMSPIDRHRLVSDIFDGRCTLHALGGGGGGTAHAGLGTVTHLVWSIIMVHHW